MTCVAAVADRASGVVWMGGDSAISTKRVIDLASTPKVWHLACSIVIGYSGTSMSEHSALVHRLRLPTIPKKWHDVERWVHIDFAAAASLAYRQHGIGEVEGVILLGLFGRIFEIERGSSAIESQWSYAAVGDGQTHAIGSLASTSGTPRSRVAKALRAADRHCPSVRAPFKILHVQNTVMP